ncbi:ARF GAP with effector function(s) [Malassezia yamatoensis]|uniref:ARF GAP with effector function(S) n=1 Tax=Malassezia yamatoensis TaxID=253288 RepID=A0AAJ5YUR8_9BASI|nr:ARF GAP with effector function(s) [Malassezia yamatoensis]
MSYAGRKPQSRAEAEANARTLRALVKQPDNKVCADCKKNDTRWSAWNLGCFLCIRCSGIHRSMGTHISRVKSIDLDMWTAEQMESVQKWGNRLANLYWEANLKAGHIPPDHKIESFIRSKYESRRWALSGAPPADPSVLLSDQEKMPASAQPSASTTDGKPSMATSSFAAGMPKSAKAPSTTRGTSSAKSAALLDFLSDDFGAASLTPSPTTSAPKPSPAPAHTTSAVNKQAVSADRFGSATGEWNEFSTSSRNPTNFTHPGSSNVSQPKASTPRGGGLFDLDWDENPQPTSTQPSIKSSRGKEDILSLFSSSSTTSVPTAYTTPTPSIQENTTSFPTSFPAPLATSTKESSAPPPSFSSAARTNPSSDIFNTQDVWGMPQASSTASRPSQPKDDAFANIWGDFS